jgi:hypothetical protein
MYDYEVPKINIILFSNKIQYNIVEHLTDRLTMNIKWERKTYQSIKLVLIQSTPVFCMVLNSGI